MFAQNVRVGTYLIMTFVLKLMFPLPASMAIMRGVTFVVLKLNLQIAVIRGAMARAKNASVYTNTIK